MKLKGKVKRLLSAVNNNNTNKSITDLPSKIHVFDNTIDNIYYLQGALKNSQDMVYRHFYIGNTDRRISLAYLDGMVEKNLVEDQIIKPIMNGINDVDKINTNLLLMEKR